MRLFASFLTYSQPASNYKGENELNRSVLQKITKGFENYPIVSSTAIRARLREGMAEMGLPINRQRIPITAGTEKDQITVRMNWSDANVYADDKLMGYMCPLTKEDKKTCRKEKGDDFQLKRNSIVQLNHAVALEPYRHDSVLMQSPLIEAPYKQGSALINQEILFTDFCYTLSMNMSEVQDAPDWARTFFQVICQLDRVGGNHARSYYQFVPASVVLRLTNQLAAGYNMYGFDKNRNMPDLIDSLIHGDYPGNEFYLGGNLVKTVIPEAVQKQLVEKGVTLDRNPNRLIAMVVDKALTTVEVK